MPTTPVRASPPAKLHGRHLVASNPFVSCTTLAMGAEGLCPRFPPNANLCRLLILPSGECSRMMCHSLIARRSDVADSRFARCPPMAWLSMPSTWTFMRACAPANYGCTFPAKRCRRSLNEAASSGGPTPRLFWFHPYQSPRRPTSPAVPPPMRAARLRRPASAWSAASNASRLGCWALHLTAGQRSGAGDMLLPRASTT